MKKTNIRHIIRQILFENFDIDESGFPRLMNIMRGNVNSVDKVGIVTAENPQNQPLSNEENNKRMKSLISDVKSLNKGFIKINGNYNRPENSLAIINIDYDSLKKLSDKYNQESFIFGEKTKTDNDKTTMSFSMINFDDSIISNRDVVVSNKDVQNFDDFFSALKGRKFVIPFFDEKYEKQTSKIPNQIKSSKI